MSERDTKLCETERKYWVRNTEELIWMPRMIRILLSQEDSANSTPVHWSLQYLTVSWGASRTNPNCWLWPISWHLAGFQALLSHPLDHLRNFELELFFWNKNCVSSCCKMIIVQSTVMSVLNYGGNIYMNTTSSIMEPLDAIFHSILCFITGHSLSPHHCTLYSKAG